MSALILGLGYIGASLTEQLLEDGSTVVAMDNLFSTDRAVVDRFERHPRFHFVAGSITDPAALDGAFALLSGARVREPGTRTSFPVLWPLAPIVFLLAAQASGHPDAATAEYTEETNLRGPRLVVEAMRRAGVHRLVYASSLKILGEPLPERVGESAPYGVQTDLAHLSKVYVEKYLEMASRRGPTALSAVAVRLGLVYGVGPLVKRDPRFMTAPNKFCQQALRGETIEVRADGPLGLIHVEDAARALRAAAALLPEHGYRAINAPVEVSTVADVARRVVLAVEKRGIVARVAPSLPGPLSHEGGTPSPPSWEREGAPPVRVESSLAAAGLGLRRTLDEGLPEFLDFLLAQEDAR